MNRGFNTAVSGLNSARMGLAVTGHNMSNVNTPGFTRQQSIQQTFGYQSIGNNLQVGMGNDIQAIRQVRDRFLDMQFRGEIGRMSFHGVVFTTGNRIEEIYGELQSQYSTLSIKQDLWDAINELVMNPSGIHTRRSFIASMQSYITKMNNVHERMNREQDTLDLEVRRTVTRINQITTRINQLNGQIGLHEASGQRANDFRDERNLLLDELSRLIPIEYRENLRGEISITTGGNELVAHGTSMQIGLRFVAPGSHLVEPVFTGSRQILDYDEQAVPLFRYGSVGAQFGNDNSELFGLIVARGMFRTDYTSLQNVDFVGRNTPLNFPEFQTAAPDWSGLPARPDSANYPGGVHDTNFINDFHNYLLAVSTHIATVNNYLATTPGLNPDQQAADMAAMAAFGNEFNQFLASFLDFVSTSPGDPAIAGNDAQIAWRRHRINLEAFNGQDGVLTATKREMDILFNHTVNMINGTLNGVNLNNEWGVPIFTEIIPGLGLTMGNVQINPLLLEPDGHNLIGLAENAGFDPITGDPTMDRDDGRRAKELLDAWSRPMRIFEPIDGAHPMSITDAYRFVIDNLSVVTNRALTFHDAQVDLINELDNRRISMSGVSMDEEMRNMMTFQHAFNAASRIVNVIDSMIDRVINGTGRAGL